MLKKLLALPIEKKIGQLFFIGLPGLELDAASRDLLEMVSPGGICLFARNIRRAEQTRRLLDDVKSALPVEPFLSIDEEGGLVDRLRRITTPFPAAVSIKTIEQAETLASITAEILLRLGFNMNFAPVVDVIDNERRKFSNGLYSRAFGNSKEEVVRLTAVYLKTLQIAGCLGCLKHFPGLGASNVDSHESLPSVNLAPEEFFAVDLFPYQKLLASETVYAVMVAHAAYPLNDLQERDTDGKLLPSSLSFNFVTELLRRRLGFDGLVITDDLEMGAIVNNYGIGDACRRAIAAGEDMLSICADAGAVLDGYAAILDAVRAGEISESRIDESLRRIAKIKTSIQKPLPLDTDRWQTLSQNIARLNEQVNYQYGG